MTEYRKNVPPPNLFATDQGMVAKADAEWESIMVQITLAWVIILGYLISMDMSESRGLAEEAKSSDSKTTRSNRSSRLLVRRNLDRNVRNGSNCNGTSNCRGFCWNGRSCVKSRDFFPLVVKFADAELVTLSDDLSSLPTEPSFQKLNTEIDRIFLSGTEKVSAEEIGRLMKAV